MPVELYPHQIEAVAKLDNGKILWGGVGTGKSITAVAYYMQKEAPKDVIVITTAKKRDSLDWEEEFAKYGIGKRRDGTTGGVLTVDSWNNLSKYRDVKDCMFIFDEQRLVGNGSWVDAFIRVTRGNRWILLSATPGDTWLDYIPVFIANGFYKNRTEFKREHVIYKSWSKFPKVERYTGVGRLVRLRNELLVEMPYMRRTQSTVVDVPVEYDVEAYNKVVKRKWNIFESRPLKDAGELFLVMRKTVNSNTSRLEAIRSLSQKHAKLIVFYNFDYELELLRSLASGSTLSEWNGHSPFNKEDKWLTQKPVSTTLSHQGSILKETPTSGVVPVRQTLLTPQLVPDVDTTTTSITTFGSTFQVAEWNGHKHEPIPTTDRWIYLVQYMAGAEGWNCVETNAMAFYSLPYSWKLWHQARGRIDRLNTTFTDLFYYVLKSDSSIDKAIARALDEKKSFNESAQKWAK